ncbi:hypothetical protein HGRIS_011333 [Hohenbuehelia grisea]|uniref:Uncharacterized protein n=1 Tax=Hohenbuehelia grisea TaxID=104357 RepID=A0ABR3JVU9_9AGAR
MFSKSLVASVVALALSVQVSAHAAVSPALGVEGTPVRGNVQRPSAARPCGNINVAQTLDTSTPIAAGADGSFTVTGQNFNAGQDGSLQFTASVDAAATGQNFVAATVTKNGELAPNAVQTTQITAQLPAGTKCTGGQAGNLCLVSFKSAGNFGNCVVVQQGAAAGGAVAGAAAGGAAAGAATGAAAGGAAAGAATGAAAGRAGRRPAGGRAGRRPAAAGTRAPRALLDALRSVEARGDEDAEVVRRGVTNWVWA